MKTTLFAAVIALGSLLSSAAFAHEHDGRWRDDDRGFATSKRGPGFYEQQPVQQWVEGRWAQIPCRGGYRTEWQPGHYETVMQWVWVPRHEGHHWGREGNHEYGWR